MELKIIDVLIFLAFFAFVVAFSMFKSRREKSSEDYFLASRGLVWPLIGLSIVAANISTEQLVGMAGQGAGSVGLAVSAWQLTGSVGIVIIAFTFLPRFLRAGIYTMPEFLEYRYNAAARGIMAFMTVIIYVAVLLTAVLYSGGLTLSTIFGLDLAVSVWIVGGIAALYTTWGGLKAVAWADLIQGLGLLAGGIVTFLLGLEASGGWESFRTQNADRLHMILPADDAALPWTGVLGGMWIVILYYCGLNQFIVQRNLAARSLRHGQLGMVFAGGLWLLVPFAIVMPGIMAISLYKEDLRVAADESNRPLLEEYEDLRAAPGKEEMVVFKPDDEWKERFPQQASAIEEYNAGVERAAKEAGRTPSKRLLSGYKADAAYPTLIKKLVPPGLRGFMFAAIAGAVVSSLASMLNSASTIFTMDVYKRLLRPGAAESRLVILGRAMTLLFVVAACLMAPALDDPKFGGVFQFIQQFQGYIWPGVVAAFLIAFAMPRAPSAAAILALIGGPIIYGVFQHFTPEVHFLIQVLMTFGILCALMILITLVAPLPEPRKLPVREEMRAPSSLAALALGALVIVGVAVFFIVFW